MADEKPGNVAKVDYSKMNLREMADFFDNWELHHGGVGYETYLRSIGYRIDKDITSVFSQYVPDMSASIFDAATGTGFVGLELRMQGYNGRIVGLDLARNLLEQAGEKRVFSGLIRASLTEIPFFDNQFDATICAAAIGAARPEAILGLVSPTKIGGYIIFSVRGINLPPEDFGYKDLMQKLEDQRIWRPVNEHIFNDRERSPFHVFVYQKLNNPS